MRKIFSTAILMGLAMMTFAGNPDRAGSAGANQLLLNPWARSAGIGSAMNSFSKGAESMYLNVAGLAFTTNIDIGFSHSRHLVGADISMNAAGLAKRVGESGSLAIGITSIGFGDNDITTTAEPEGQLGTFSPSATNITIAYAKEFSNSIYGGIGVKLINTSIANVSGAGVAFDAGIQYLTGANENVHFGISLKNVGPPMRMGGDGLSRQVVINEKNLTTNQRADKYELPSLIDIGGAYDFIMAGGNHVLTTAFNFTSNSFINDQYSIGVQYGFKDRLEIRGAYTAEDGIGTEDALTIWSPWSGGLSVNLPFGDSGKIAIDYSYRPTIVFSGTHSVGVRISME